MGTVASITLRCGDDKWHFRQGDVLSFGRGSSGSPVDVVLSENQHLSAEAGNIRVVDGGWILQNRNRWAPMHLAYDGVECVLQRGASITVTARHGVVSMDLDGTTQVDLEIETTAQVGNEERPEIGPPKGTVRRIKEGTRHHWALLLLCEPSLRAGRLSTIPANKAIASTLRLLGIDLTATDENVETHLKHVRKRLGLIENPGYHVSRSGNQDRNARIVLADTAIRRGEVKPEHLKLIDDLTT